jgi:hypothetical protein
MKKQFAPLIETKSIQLITGRRKKASLRNTLNKITELEKILNEITELKNINTKTDLKNNSKKRKI